MFFVKYFYNVCRKLKVMNNECSRKQFENNVSLNYCLSNFGTISFDLNEAILEPKNKQYNRQVLLK